MAFHNIKLGTLEYSVADTLEGTAHCFTTRYGGVSEGHLSSLNLGVHRGDVYENVVKLCAERGIPVTTLPGACAAICALTLSALPTGRFAFEGFLSTNKTDRKKRLESLKNDPHTLIFYEAPHKLCNTLKDLHDAFGDRKISLCRELTKLNEEVLRTTLSGAISHFDEVSPRGEFVLVIEGFTGEVETAVSYPEDPEEHVQKLMGSGMKRMDAIKAAAAERGLSKREFYAMLVCEE